MHVKTTMFACRIARDELLDQELCTVDRRQKKELKQLENEIPQWLVIVDELVGSGESPFCSYPILSESVSNSVIYMCCCILVIFICVAIYNAPVLNDETDDCANMLPLCL